MFSLNNIAVDDQTGEVTTVIPEGRTKTKEQIAADVDKEADEKFGVDTPRPKYDPMAYMTSGTGYGNVQGYDDLLKLAEGVKPAKETKKQILRRGINDAIAAIGDAFTYGYNAYKAGSNGTTPLDLNPAQNLSAQAKARYEKALAVNKEARDKYLGLLTKAAELSSTGSTAAKGLYDKAYNAELGAWQDKAKAKDAWKKSRYAALTGDQDDAADAQKQAVANDHWQKGYDQRNEQFYAPSTTTSSRTGDVWTTDPNTGKSEKRKVSSTTTNTTQRKKF